MKMKFKRILSVILSCFCLTGCTHVSEEAYFSTAQTPASVYSTAPEEDKTSFSLTDIPAYSGSPFIEINDNHPFFTADELNSASASYKSFQPLDALGRCGAATASVGTDLLPTEPRGSIGMIKPSGWHTVRCDDIIEDKYLFNRCHLIAYELCGENANALNLITGTRYMNVSGMLPWENKTAEYVKETGNHVLYRSTPVFNGDDLVAGGVLLEAKSVEDNGSGLEFCVYCYNVQPGIIIDYATGDSSEDDAYHPETPEPAYIGNINSHKFHYLWCESVNDMKEKNKIYFTTREEAVEDGYSPCKICNP